MHLIQSTPEKIIIRMSANVSLANALRRSVNEVKTLAIDEVEIFKNDSALYDEFIANRLGLIPLRTEASMNDKTEISLKLSKVGPGVAVSGDIEGNAEVVYSAIPITLLERGQELELVAIARLGTGTEHDKHTPGLCFYRHLSLVHSKNPQVVRLIDQSKGLIASEKRQDSILCDIDEATCEEIERLEPGAVSDADELLFFVESFGHLPAKEILLQAIRVLGHNVEAFERALK
jgi:DNA-directed RNA polymerase subunit D